MITRLSAFALSALLASGALAADSVGEPGRSAGAQIKGSVTLANASHLSPTLYFM
jgi:hypothetical protein